jgi:ribosomal protein S18 acetylase RimI-like enzyme
MIDYRTNTASEENILYHLETCDETFFNNLCNRVNIKVYSKKIKENAVLFEAWNNNHLVGLLAVYFNNIKDKIAYITNVSVSKKYEKNGIASELMKRCIEYGQTLKFRAIKLEVAVDNENAIHFYEKFNFKCSENKNFFYMMKAT